MRALKSADMQRLRFIETNRSFIEWTFHENQQNWKILISGFVLLTIDDILVAKSYHRSSESAGIDIWTYEREIKNPEYSLARIKKEKYVAGWIIFYYYFMIIIGAIIFVTIPSIGV